MNNLLAWLFWVTFLANLFGIDVVLVSGRCQSDQRSFLLQIKNSLKFNSSSSVNLVQWGQTTDCCNWKGVHCDEAGRVTDLNLTNESISGGIENATGLFRLRYLKRLNLAYNRFNATQIPTRLANLTDLIYLNLSNAGFGGQIPIEISAMKRLITLDFSTSSLLLTSVLKLENPNLSAFIQNLTDLRELYLDGVNMSAHGNGWCQALSSYLPNLQVLSLSNCFLSGPICSSIAQLPSLSTIRLDQNKLLSPVPDSLADLSNLTSLHLSNCGLNGTFPEKILQLQKLETLDLADNDLLQVSLPDLPKNISLQTLKLSNTNFSSTLPESIGNLKKLSRIELSGCNFIGPIPTAVANLTQLVYLDFSFNNFTDSIPFFRFSENLNYLDLSSNLLTGGISSTGWEQLLNLVYVDLRFNALNGIIPRSLFAILSLQKLQLANNQFEGQLPEFPNASSSKLDTLDLSGNRLEGPIPMSVFDLTELKILSLPFNEFNGTVQLHKIQRLRNLTSLDLSYNSLVVNASNIDSSVLPQITTLKLASCNLSTIPDLKSRSKLFHLDLSENQISGEIPNWIWEVNNRELIYLNLSHNFLVGLQEPYAIPNLSTLDLHSNRLQGKTPLPPPSAVYVDYSSNSFSSIPAEIGNFLNFNVFFSFSNNTVTGFIPGSICNATSLQVLDLSHNNFSGVIPRCLIERSETLGVLNLRQNRLTGPIPDIFPESCRLQTLGLNRNQLEGKVPKSLANCKKLEILDLGNNEMEDNFPCRLKTISNLRVLVLRSNKFYGPINCPEINGSWPMIQIVDLAVNNFSGRLPGECLKTWEAMMVDEDKARSNLKHLQFGFLRLSQLYYRDAITVTMKGREMELVKILTLFTSIDLSCNNFQGPIPEEVTLFKSLHLLNMSHNALTGPIPSSIGNLRQLESLDLSRNNLSGEIPLQLARLYFLSFLNLSYNRLVGKIPSGTQIQTFSSTSFEGNEGLCGLRLPKECTSPSGLQPSASPSSNEFDWPIIAIGLGFEIGAAAVVVPLILSNEWRKAS